MISTMKLHQKTYLIMEKVLSWDNQDHDLYKFSEE